MKSTSATEIHERSLLTYQNLFDAEQFQQLLDKSDNSLTVFRNHIKDFDHSQQFRLEHGTSATELVHERAAFMDQILIQAWRLFDGHNLPEQHVALVAVGGYGRCELHPCSDIDLLILVSNKRYIERYDEPISNFLRFLWDIGLEPGQAVRTVTDCAQLAKQDVTVVTNLIESRYILGSRRLLEKLQDAISQKNMWPSRRFFSAKLEEQKERHKKYDETGYKLEPDIKESPGGLRDLHVISWVAKRHFDADTLPELVEHGFLTSEELETLLASQDFLWKVRMVLHFITRRKDDQLLFDCQISVAKALGYEDSNNNLAVEAFMKDYFCAVNELLRLNEILLQYFKEAILRKKRPIQQISSFNSRFQNNGGYLEVKKPDVFEKHPEAILEAFLLLQQNWPKVHDLRAETIRLIRQSLPLIDDTFRNDMRNRALFLEILRQPKRVAEALSYMNHYGVLGAYIPSFGQVIGQTQYDLFHIYTVDAHTLFVVRNLRRFANPKWSDEFPQLKHIFRQIDKPELLYLAGLFHDIGKGRGGDHSEIGAQEAQEFCLQHGLSAFDAKLVSWLVRNHLIMSTVSQKQDLNDPEVIENFANKVGDETHLNHLVLLTVADMRGTSNKVWNEWKGQLLMQLYSETLRALRRGIGEPQDITEKVHSMQIEGLANVKKDGTNPADVVTLWRTMKSDYFQRHTSDEIAWHAEKILTSPQQNVVVAANNTIGAGSTALFIYTRERDHLFAIITSVLDQFCLNIVDARLSLSNDGHALQTFRVLDDNGQSIKDRSVRTELVTAIKRAVLAPNPNYSRQVRRTTRTQKNFPIKTSVSFYTDTKYNHTVMELFTTERPGILLRVAQVLANRNVRILQMRINTYGERVEDVFFISTRDYQPIFDNDVLSSIRSDIEQKLEETDKRGR